MTSGHEDLGGTPIGPFCDCSGLSVTEALETLIVMAGISLDTITRGPIFTKSELIAEMQRYAGPDYEMSDADLLFVFAMTDTLERLPDGRMRLADESEDESVEEQP